LERKMLLSQTCEYALRAVVCIAERGEDQPVLAKDIARRTDVPLKYLQKVLRDLVHVGLLTSSRGIGGGFQLRLPARKVRLADVMAPFDDVLQRTNCPFGNPDCGVANPCPVHDRWSGVVNRYKAFLETTSVADLVAKPQKKRKRGPGKRKKNKRGRSS
jgi:Rrf2 family protein